MVAGDFKTKVEINSGGGGGRKSQIGGRWLRKEG